MSDPSRDYKPKVPTLLQAMASIGAIVLVAPIIGLVSATPWKQLPELIQNSLVGQALALSLLSATSTALVCLILGVPLGIVLARYDFKGIAIARSLITLPMLLPPVVAGAALLLTFGRRGLLGQPLYEITGFSLPFSIWAVILANLFVALPFTIIPTHNAVRDLDLGYENAAATLGASPYAIMSRITIPLIKPAIRAGLVLSWARSLGEFGATITFAGNLPAHTQTLPLAVSVALETDRNVAIAMSLLLVTVSLIILLTMRNRWWPT